MAIQAQTIIDRMRRVGLDAEGSDYYRDDLDLIPAINAAIKWLIPVINIAFGAKKLGEEVFQEIVFTRVFQTSQFSRVNFDPAALGHEVWTILAIYPLPTVTPSTAVVVSLAKPEDSIYRNDISHLTSDNAAKRLTFEEWIDNKKNPFAAGNEITTCLDLISYAYLNYSNYTSSAYTLTIPREVEIRPELKEKFVTITYVSVPTEVVLASDTIPFPIMFENLLFEKSLNYVSRKQGDGTNIFAVTNNDINALLRATL